MSDLSNIGDHGAYAYEVKSPRPARLRRNSGAAPRWPSGASSTNTRRPSCGSARRTNRPCWTIVLSQRSAVVAGTAAAMHRLETGTRSLRDLRLEQVEQHVPGRVGEQLLGEIAGAQPPGADDRAHASRPRLRRVAGDERLRVGRVPVAGPVDSRARVAAMRLTSSLSCRSRAAFLSVATSDIGRERCALRPPAPVPTRALPRRRRSAVRRPSCQPCSGQRIEQSRTAPRRSPRSARRDVAVDAQPSSSSDDGAAVPVELDPDARRSRLALDPLARGGCDVDRLGNPQPEAIDGWQRARSGRIPLSAATRTGGWIEIVKHRLGRSNTRP